ncbi:MAG: hypothetical protein CMM32_07175 [Rhodospirillaceae bacterium]|nr:hypothetical protein [Rhodospirillaceae bacterium]|tara:strand:- start:1089 stop:1457 length:369 start_codon:yes stop_codon:yes gene_type:complete
MADSTKISTYRGKRYGNLCLVTVDDSPLDRRLDIVAVPLADFEWGYNGAGPARLSFAILAHYFRDDGKAIEAYRTFCDLVVSEFREDDWSITTKTISGYFQSTVEVTMTLSELLERARALRE